MSGWQLHTYRGSCAKQRSRRAHAAFVFFVAGMFYYLYDVKKGVAYKLLPLLFYAHSQRISAKLRY